MQIDRKELIAILGKLSLSLNGQSMFGLNFIFDTKHIFALSNNMFCIYPFESDFKCSVQSDALQKILKSLREDTINISLKDDSNKLLIKSGKSKAEITVNEVQDIPEYINIRKIIQNKSLLEDSFIQGLKFCLFSTSDDVSSPVLESIMYRKGVLASSDNNRITEYKISRAVDGIDNEILLPSKFVSNLLKFDNLKYVSIQENWVCFIADDGLIFGFTMNNGEFPEYVDFLKIDKKNTIKIKIPENFIDTILSSSVMAFDDLYDRYVDIRISKSSVSCKSINNIGWIENINSIEYDGDDIFFSINPDFLVAILQQNDIGDYSDRYLYYHDNKIFFMGENFRHVISTFSKE